MKVLVTAASEQDPTRGSAGASGRPRRARHLEGTLARRDEIADALSGPIAMSA